MNNNKKKFNKSYLLIIIPSVIFCLLFSGIILGFVIFNFTYVSPQEKIIDSIGKSECEVYYSNNGFQEYTDFAVYTYSEPEIVKSENFRKAYNKNKLESYLNNFENMVNSYSDDREIKKNYSFDKSIIDNEDYIYIYDKSDDEELYDQFENYDIYIFDIQSEKLYYFHNNI